MVPKRRPDPRRRDFAADRGVRHSWAPRLQVTTNPGEAPSVTDTPHVNSAADQDVRRVLRVHGYAATQGHADGGTLISGCPGGPPDCARVAADMDDLRTARD